MAFAYRTILVAALGLVAVAACATNTSCTSAAAGAASSLHHECTVIGKTTFLALNRHLDQLAGRKIAINSPLVVSDDLLPDCLL